MGYTYEAQRNDSYPVTFGCLSQPGVALIVWSAQKKQYCMQYAGWLVVTGGGRPC